MGEESPREYSGGFHLIFNYKVIEKEEEEASGEDSEAKAF